jgi:glycosyltransferase involved in cell wall biosynthesis
MAILEQEKIRVVQEQDRPDSASLRMWRRRALEPKNVGELGKAISVLLGDKKLREKLGKNAYSKIMRDHNWSDVIKKYI